VNIKFFFAFLLSTVVSAAEYRPASVWTSAETLPEHEVAKLCDGSLATYASFLDDSRTGKSEQTVPPNGESPVTATFVLDFGEARTLRGFRLVAQKSMAAKMASHLSVFTCDDAEGKTNVKFLIERMPQYAVFASHSAFITWDAPATSRFWGVRIDDSYERPGNFTTWFAGAYRGLQLEMGIEASGTGKYFLTEIAEIAGFSELPTDYRRPNPPEMAFPADRLQRDWLMQDHGMNLTDVFVSETGNETECALVRKVLQDLGVSDVSKEAESEALRDLQARFRQLESVPGNDPRWRALYYDLCKLRRIQRLAAIPENQRRIVYAKHTVIGGGTMHGGTENLTDTQFDEHNLDFRPGGKLCVLTVREDGTVQNKVLLDRPEGFIRDPDVSYDGKTVLFSMRNNQRDDDFHLYTLNLETRELRQITSSLKLADGTVYPCADTEPCFTPDGHILYQSTRCEQLIPCWKNLTSNLYRCNAEGKEIQRIGFDQVNTYFPQVLNDGRISFTRWEYNDRTAMFLQPLFIMNPDGTAQMEYYGNGCELPISLFHARPIPGSTKLIAISSGHHVVHKGKLVLVDRRKGTQGDSGIEFVAGSSPDGRPGRVPSWVGSDPWYLRNRTARDFFGQLGPQWQYPWAFDETHYLVTFLPEGSPKVKGPFGPGFGVYYMDAEGRRELLAFDPTVSCGQSIPIAPRQVPQVQASQVDWEKPFGTFYVQNVYIGLGLAGRARPASPGEKNDAGSLVPKIKKLRVVGLEYRPCWIGMGDCMQPKTPEFLQYSDSAPTINHTMISINGAWDVRHVFGEADVEPDGSCFFEVPANNAVYFQLLDEKGRCVQTMRSWTLLLPGEQMSCVGCHEEKNQVTPAAQRFQTQAMSKPAQALQPLPGQPPHPLLESLRKKGIRNDVANYMGVNGFGNVVTADSGEVVAPVAFPVGFSFPQLIQPILDRHCIRCHHAGNEKTDFVLTGESLPEHYRRSLRAFSRSYVTLTHDGEPTRLVNWVSPRGQAAVLPPGVLGSVSSQLMNYLEPSHYDVKLMEEEKRLIATWIDLAVPFSGSFTEGNMWDENQKKVYEYHLKKRRAFAEEEVKSRND